MSRFERIEHFEVEFLQINRKKGNKYGSYTSSPPVGLSGQMDSGRSEFE
jgi:hypothetical protein